MTAGIDWNMTWAAMSAIFTAIGAICTAIAMIAIFMALHQLRFEAWLKAQETFTAQDFTKKRAKLFSRFDDNRTEWTEEERQSALDVCRKMTELTDLARYLGSQINVWDRPIADAWDLVKGLIDEERERTGFPDKWKSFEAAAEKARTRLARKGQYPRKKKN